MLPKRANPLIRRTIKSAACLMVPTLTTLVVSMTNLASTSPNKWPRANSEHGHATGAPS